MGSLIEVCQRYDINTPLLLAHFLAQCSHESAHFKLTKENLNYSASGLKKTFGKYFRNTSTKGYARNPSKIASRVYGGRYGNGGESTGDGWKYRGRGYIQLTFKSNYSAFNKTVPDDVVANPELVSSKYPLLAAGWYWNSRNINKTAGKGSSRGVVTRVTKLVNGGTNGLEDRIKEFNKFYNVLK